MLRFPTPALLVVLLAALEAEGAVRVVSNLAGRGCSDAGAGTPAQPFCTLQAALSGATPGDVIRVEGGSYGPGEVVVGVSGAPSAPITLRAEPPLSAVVIGPGGAGEAFGSALRINGSYLVIDGFEVRDAAGTGIRNNGSFVTLRRNWVHHNGTRCDPITVDKCGQGIASNNTPNKLGIVIERNVASFNGSGGKSEDHDYYLHGQGMIVRNNVAIAADDFGFQIYPDCDDCLIYNNVAFGNRLSGFLIGGSIVDNAYSTNVKVFNNISVGNGQSGFAFYQPGNQPMTMRNNLAFANAAGPIFIPAGFTALDNANLFQVDPLFVDAGGYDFHLRPGSPAIDTGDPSLAPTDDIDGDLRIQGAGVELGIDEVPGPLFDAGVDGGPQGKPDGGQAAADGGPMNSPDAGVPLGGAARGCGCGTDRAVLAAWLSALAVVAVSRRARSFAARR